MTIKELTAKHTPARVFWKIQTLDQPVWLDSAMTHNQFGRYSFITANPTAHFTVDASGKINSEPALKTDDWAAALDQWLALYQHQLKHMYPFVGGAIGMISYDLKNLIEQLPQTVQADIDIPYIDFKHYDWTYVYDHKLQRAFLVSYHLNYDFSTIIALVTDLAEPTISQSPFITGQLTSNIAHEQYLVDIERIRQYIEAGDVYQINYTQRFSAPYNGDHCSLYYTLRQWNAAPFGTYLQWQNYQVLSSSPERFMHRINERLHTRPIKGTIARSDDKAQDDINKKTLLYSEKDRSELLMIVDLERNDLSKLARKNSVSVPENFVIESYETVHHLVSTVLAKLKEEVTFSDIIKATFPGGSITGAPKIRAMQIIDELEPTARNVYTGSIGYINGNGDFDFNIAIRTIVTQGDQLHYQVGGGIVWDSDPAAEYAESLTKGVALKRVIHYDQTIKA